MPRSEAYKMGMKNKNKTRWVLLGLMIAGAVVVLLLWAFYFNKPKTQNRANDSSIYQLEYTVRRSSVADYLEIVGTVDAPIYQVVSSVSGALKTFDIQVGDRVSKDATIAVLDDIQYRLNYLEAKVDYENALYDSPISLEQKQLQFLIAERNLKNATVRSPVSGIITEVSAREGANISQNGAICTIVEDDALFVQGFLDEVDIQKVRTSQKVLFEFKSFGLTYEGKIARISQIANSESGIVVIPAEFSFNDDPRKKGIIPGLTCTVKIVLLEKSDALFIPTNALKRDQKGTYVLVKGEKEGETLPTYIKTGVSTTNSVEVLEGLQEGQKVIIAPSSAVLNTFSPQTQQGGGLNLNMIGGLGIPGGR